MKRHHIIAGSFLICLLEALAISMLFPKKTVSESERRYLAPKPVLSTGTLLDGSFMEDTETYLLDHFPFRDGLRRIKAYFAYGVLQQKENNGIYVADGYASKLEPTLNEASIARLADKMSLLRQQYFPQQDAWYAIVPSKDHFLADKNGYPAMDLGRMADSLAQALDDAGGGFAYIDLISGLTIEDYYRTDTHWRQECLLGTARTVADAMGAAISLDEGSLVRHEIRDFYGVYYGQAALPMEPDTIVYLTDETIDAAFVWDLEENMADGTFVGPDEEGAVLRPVYRTDVLTSEESLDRYDVFLGGASALQVVRNPYASTDRRLIVFRDSYTSSLAPLLLSGYSEIVLVDLRYIHSSLIGRYVDFADADILFLYGVAVVNNPTILK